MKPSLAELSDALLAVFEGPARLTAFRDAGGVWTIGRGHTLGVKAGQTITPAESIAFFAQDQAPLLSMVAGFSPLPGAALCSFGYNCGRTALARVLAGQDVISNPVHTTDKKGNVENGLVSRRRLEALLIASA